MVHFERLTVRETVAWITKNNELIATALTLNLVHPKLSGKATILE